jgi:hypothetical protein
MFALYSHRWIWNVSRHRLADPVQIEHEFGIICSWIVSYTEVAL